MKIFQLLKRKLSPEIYLETIEKLDSPYKRFVQHLKSFQLIIENDYNLDIENIDTIRLISRSNKRQLELNIYIRFRYGEESKVREFTEFLEVTANSFGGIANFNQNHGGCDIKTMTWTESVHFVFPRDLES